VSYQYPDRVSIEEVSTCELTPKHAVLEIVVEGESVAFGNEALSKSQEIADLLSELQKIDYSKENVTLEGISIRASTGKILKSSSARFSLKLDNIPMELIPKMLGVISSQKNIEMTDMSYEFGNLDAEKSTLLKECCLKAKNQGQEICNTLGVSMLGVYSMSQTWSDPITDGISKHHARSRMTLSKTRSAQPQELEGLDFSANYKGKLSLTLKFDFRVGEFDV